MTWTNFTPNSIKLRLLEAFGDKQASVLSEVVYDAYQNLVKSDDFNELKAIVKDIALEQKELVAAQKRTELRLEELAQAQKRTEFRVEELAQAQKQTELEIRELTNVVKETNVELGGLSRSMSYALENEAYRMVPKTLKDKYGIDVPEKIIRTEFQNHEINLLGRAMRNGKEVWIVGETKLRLDDRRLKKPENIFEVLEKKVQAVKAEYGEVEVVRVLITHFAGQALQNEARKRDVIVLQSFDW